MMFTYNDLGRMMVSRATWAMEQKDPESVVLTSCAKLFTSEAVNEIADLAMQVQGGHGYLKGTMVERLYRDARFAVIAYGTSEMQRAVIAKDSLDRSNRLNHKSTGGRMARLKYSHLYRAHLTKTGKYPSVNSSFFLLYTAQHNQKGVSKMKGLTSFEKNVICRAAVGDMLVRSAVRYPEKGCSGSGHEFYLPGIQRNRKPLRPWSGKAGY